MNEDLRYLERLLVREADPLVHPSNESLAAFIDGKLEEGDKKENLIAHLAVCDRCLDIITTTPPQQSFMRLHKPSRFQMLNVLGAIAASLLLFIFVTIPEHSELGILNLSQGLSQNSYKVPRSELSRKELVDADKELIKIIKQTDMSKIDVYQEAVKLELEEEYQQARSMYKQSLIKIRHNPDSNERIRQKIVINYKLLKLGIKEKQETDKSVQEYRKILRYDIGVYLLHFNGA